MDDVAALGSAQGGDFALLPSITNFRCGRSKNQIVRMLADLFADRIDLHQRAIHCFRPGHFAGYPNGKENRSKPALLHPRDINAPGGAACSKIKLAVEKTLRPVVVRVHDRWPKLELARPFTG